MNFSKIFVLSIATVLLLAGNALAIEWVYSPYQPLDAYGNPLGTIAFGETGVVGVQEINDPEYGTQTSAIYGAGFMTYSSAIKFDTDLYTWDSYSLEGDANNDGGSKGWWDVFIVNINQVGYYWDLVSGGSGTINDPVVSSDYTGGYGVFDNSVLPGATYAFGGEDYGNGTLESDSWDALILELEGGGNTTSPYYVSVILDTKTLDYADEAYPSWGSFHVAPVPEPATMLLIGSGLLGIAGLGRKRLIKKS